VSDDHIYIETDIFDNVTINGRISKKLCQKVFVNRIDYLQNQLAEKEKEIERLSSLFDNQLKIEAEGLHKKRCGIDLQSKLELSQKREVALKKAVEFYADKNNWKDVQYNTVFDIIIVDDVEHIVGDSLFAGKIARQALKEVEEVK